MEDSAVEPSVHVWPGSSGSPAGLPATLPAGPIIFDVGGLLKHFEALTDARHARGKRYALPLVLLLIALAKLCGQDRPTAIADWLRFRWDILCRALRLPWPRMPHHNTLRRIAGWAVDPDQFDHTLKESLTTQPRVGWSVLISIDGKTVRGTIGPDNLQGTHLLAAYLPLEGVVLMQLEAGNRDNEISVAPKLLGCLDLRGKVVAGDAMQTQRQLSVQILDAGGDYLWLVKDNQPTLRAAIELLFTADDRTVEGGRVANDFRTARSVDKGHGRLETRQITISSELKGYVDWPGLEQVFRLERRRRDLRTGKVEQEVVYGLTSLSLRRAKAGRVLELSRAYWGIENGLHQRRDVTFQEDRIKLTGGQAGRVLASLSNLVISLLSLAGVTNLAEARRECEASLTQTLTLLAAR